MYFSISQRILNGTDNTIEGLIQVMEAMVVDVLLGLRQGTQTLCGVPGDRDLAETHSSTDGSSSPCMIGIGFVHFNAQNGYFPPLSGICYPSAPYSGSVFLAQDKLRILKE